MTNTAPLTWVRIHRYEIVGEYPTKKEALWNASCDGEDNSPTTRSYGLQAYEYESPVNGRSEWIIRSDRLAAHGFDYLVPSQEN